MGRHARRRLMARESPSGRARPKVVPLGDEIGDLIEAAGDEIDELHFRDGTQAR